MPILFALVARGTCVLAEHSATDGNASEVATNILAKTATVDSRVSYAQERHLFHLLCEDGIIYLCMADEGFGRRIPFSFLEDIQERLTAAHGGVLTMAADGDLQELFGPVLEQQMEYFSTGAYTDKMTKVKGEILDVKRGMVENIDKVLDRGDKIELLVDKTASLQGDAFRFKRSTRHLRKALWWQRIRLAVGIGLVGILLLYVLISLCCGWKFNKC
mmetsp:Transcript_3093/g.6439  ORF Transcript_3093/g.6439 Transcript_3093/m.6439 type:complete len:217 (+) Transcript_3093:197-847(+)